MFPRVLSLFIGGLILAATGPATAQSNFEIQVYPSETVAPGTTMVELHSNVAAQGSTRTRDGVLRTQGAFHETLEITQGITSWLDSQTRRGSGSVITSGRACARPRAGIYPSA